jgi:predicted ATPase/class 3 adenylate cyclase
VPVPSAVTTFLCTGIEGNTQLHAEAPDRMRAALAAHDELVRTSVATHGGVVSTTTGDGIRATFADPLDAVRAGLELQRMLANPAATADIPLRVRCGLHLGEAGRRVNDYFGTTVNRTQRIMEAAHGGQVLLSQAAALLVAGRLPAEAELADLGSVRLRDLGSPERLYQLAHPSLRRTFPPLHSLETRPNNLPQQLTSFVGRESELAEVERRLYKNRLVTVAGVGGLGKTRISLQAGADLLEDFPDGVWFVELAPLADARLVPQAVASVLGIKEDAGHAVVEALLKHIENRQLLLILDNCEHLALAVAELAKELLQASPQTKILASSRELLQIAGEKKYSLPPLPVPAEGETAIVSTLTQSPAVQLFVDRAVAAQPSFRVTAENAPAVAEICRRLDGIPLALELAAARARSLTMETMAARLSDRFRLLTQGDRTALPRQQTLRACIDWSYDLLSETERSLLRRLAVFAGGFVLVAAEAVGADGEVGTVDVLDLLDRLVQKSLVEFDVEGDRYRLLETVRQYAIERLEEAGEDAAARTRHLECQVTLAQRAFWKLQGPEQRKWMLRLDAERENLLAAHRWCDHAANGGDLGLWLVGALRGYWLHRGLLELGSRITGEALARTSAPTQGLQRCWALQAAGWLSFWMGSYAKAREYADESMSVAREAKHKPSMAFVLILKGMVCETQGDRAAALTHLEDAIALSRDVGVPNQLAQAVHALAELHRAHGNLDAAQPLYEEALAVQRRLGDSYESAICLLNLARVAIQRGSADSARTMLLDALAIAAEIGSRLVGQFVLDISAWLAAFVGDAAKAARFFGAAEAQLEETGYHREMVDEAPMVPVIARSRESLGTQAFAAAEAAGRALSYDEATTEVRAWLNQPSGAEGTGEPLSE